MVLPQVGWLTFVDTSKLASSNTSTQIFSTHKPDASVTVTQYIPGHKLSAVAVVWLSGSFHWYEYGLVPPEVTETVAVPLQKLEPPGWGGAQTELHELTVAELIFELKVQAPVPSTALDQTPVPIPLKKSTGTVPELYIVLMETKGEEVGQPVLFNTVGVAL